MYSSSSKALPSKRSSTRVRQLAAGGAASKGRDAKALALFDAARRLLAEHDFDEVSMARLARAAGCSVGALYGRFEDKAAFLRFVIALTFDGARAGLEAALEAGPKTRAEPATLAADRLAHDFADPEFAGVVRAAIKLGFTDREARAPLDAYREAATAGAARRLCKSGRKGRTLQEELEGVFARCVDRAIFGSRSPPPMARPVGKAVKTAADKIVSQPRLPEKRRPEETPSAEKPVSPEKFFAKSRRKAARKPKSKPPMKFI